jgi:large repetitive protein
VFRLSGLAPGRYRLTASADGLASSTPVDAVVRAGSTAFNTIIRVAKTAHVTGRVVMAGEPIAGARVSASRNGEQVGAASYSQRDGSFTLTGLPTGPTALAAWPFDVTSPSSLNVDGAGVDNVVVEVAKRASIRGKVTRQGTPVPGAEVLVPRVLAVKADVDGNYVLDGLTPGQVQMSAGDSTIKAFTTKTVSLKAAEDKTVDIELDLAGEARGVVVDEHGNPVPGAYVKMSSDDGNDFGESTTDAAGAFDCFNLSGGSYAIRVFPSPMAARPFAPAAGERFPPIEVSRDGATTGITLAIRDERLEIRGVVVDEAGVAVADAYVQTVTRGRGLFTLPSEMTDASGHFTIQNLAPGDYAIVAHAADGSEGLVTKVAAGTADVEVKVVRPGSVEGTFAGFSSPPSVELALLSTNVRIVTTAIVDQTRFWHRGLRAGRYAVQARAGDEVDSVEVEVKPGEVTRVHLQNRRTGRIEGVVTEYGTKRPLAGMRCEAKLSLAGPPADPAMQAVSDAAGRFSMRAPVGLVYVLCSPPDQSLSITGDDVEVAADATANVAVVAVRGKFGTVRGDAGFSLKPLTLPLQLARVDPTGGAAAAGAHDGDQLVAIDGESVRGMLPLTAMFVVMNHRPGTTVTIDVLRAGSPLAFKISVIAAR